MAEPKNGFGLSAGYANHVRDCGGCAAYTTSGLGVGIDYQFAVSENMSISPFLMSSAETTTNITVGHGILGGQVRYWSGNYFFGAHIGNYSEYATSNGYSNTGTGFGSGFVYGWERQDGGLFVMGQFDSAAIKYSGYSDIKLTALRFSTGYRWK
jgi:hypothetical protein